MITALLIFLVTYLAMAGSRLPHVDIDRPAAALCGAVAMVVAGVITLEQAFEAIDLHVLTLLVGVMILAAYLQEAHFFRRTAWWVLTRARSPHTLLWGLIFVAGGLSALLLNDTICLMFTPLVVAVVVEARLPPLPYLIALASATNIGGVVSFTGNPQNMIIGQAAAGNPGYLEYLLHALPAGTLCLAANAALISWVFRHELAKQTLSERSTPRPYIDVRLTAKTILALALFVAMAALDISLAGAAISAAALLILAAGRPPRPVLAKVDWSLLLFFAGLFVVVRGVAASGVLQSAYEALEPILTRGDITGDIAFIALAVVGSNLVSNVPYVMVAVTWVPALPDPAHGYELLAVASTLAGNLTIFGSVANVIVFEAAGPHGRIGFFRFLRIGALITGTSLVIAFAVLWLADAISL